MSGIPSLSSPVGPRRGATPDANAPHTDDDDAAGVVTRRIDNSVLSNAPQRSSLPNGSAREARFAASGSAARHDYTQMTRDNDPVFRAYRSMANGTLTLNAAIDRYGIHRHSDLARLTRVANEIAAWDAPRARLGTLIAAYYKVQREPASLNDIANSREVARRSGLAHPLDLLLMCKAYTCGYDPSLDRWKRATFAQIMRARDKIQSGQSVPAVTSALNINHMGDVLLLRAMRKEVIDSRARRIDNATMVIAQFSISSGAVLAEEAVIRWGIRNPDDFRELRIWSAMSSPRVNLATES